jgi:hypothetical protein
MADDAGIGIPEGQYWENEATKQRRTGLARVRGTAEKWQASIATLLGVFGIVAFVQGPDKLADFQKPVQIALVVIIGATAVFASVAVLLAALAAQGVPRRYPTLTGRQLADQNDRVARRTVLLLNWSRGLALAAAVLLVAGTVAAWVITLTTEKKDPEPTAIVVTSSGLAQCGKLVRSAGTQELVLVDSAGNTLIQLDTGVVSVTPVDACPKA